MFFGSFVDALNEEFPTTAEDDAKESERGRRRGRRKIRSSFIVLTDYNSLPAQFVLLFRLMTITLLSHETRQIISNLSQGPSLWLHPGATLKHLQRALVTNGPR